MSEKRIVLVGGGTGGHFYPTIAVAERLRAKASADMPISLFYFGPEPYNEAVLLENNITFVKIPTGKRRKYFSVRNVIDTFKVFFGVFFAIWHLYKIYPDVVFSKGGYTSVPVVIAAWLLRIPIMIHESDTKAGTANKLGARFARYIAIAFDEVAPQFPKHKTALVGMPIRNKLLATVDNPKEKLGVSPDRPLIFVTGGSTGAQRINNLILETLDELLPQYTILHQTGAQNETSVQRTSAELITNTELLTRYFIKGMLSVEEMLLAQSAADVIVSRAGTGTIFEIAQKGVPAILIPIPEDISHDQRSNAYAYARAGAASVIEEANLTDGLLSAEIHRIMSNPDVYKEMAAAAANFVRGDAAETVANTLLEITLEHV